MPTLIFVTAGFGPGAKIPIVFSARFDEKISPTFSTGPFAGGKPFGINGRP
jgi:hypothetical protein